jgi:hypothetical protein
VKELINSSIWLTSLDQNRRNYTCGIYRYKEGYVKDSIIKIRITKVPIFATNIIHVINKVFFTMAKPILLEYAV